MYNKWYWQWEKESETSSQQSSPYIENKNPEPQVSHNKTMRNHQVTSTYKDVTMSCPCGCHSTISSYCVILYPRWPDLGWQLQWKGYPRGYSGPKGASEQSLGLQLAQSRYLGWPWIQKSEATILTVQSWKFSQGGVPYVNGSLAEESSRYLLPIWQ